MNSEQNLNEAAVGGSALNDGLYHESVKTGVLVERFNIMPTKFENMIEVPEEIIEESFRERGMVYPRESDIDGEFKRI
jgi:hypothetical protein